MPNPVSERTLPIANQPYPDANPCRHWTSSFKKVCGASVAFDEISQVATKGRFGCALRLPCRFQSEQDYPCPHLSRLTDEEIKVQEIEAERHLNWFLENFELARMAIMFDVERQFRMYVAQARQMFDSISGSIPCPICCAGMLRYTYCGSYNGHIHAECSTRGEDGSSPGCMKWGE